MTPPLSTPYKQTKVSYRPDDTVPALPSLAQGGEAPSPPTLTGGNSFPLVTSPPCRLYKRLLSLAKPVSNPAVVKCTIIGDSKYSDASGPTPSTRHRNRSMQAIKSKHDQLLDQWFDRLGEFTRALVQFLFVPTT